jgi:hypothetical protein
MKQNVLDEPVSKLPIGATILIQTILQEVHPLSEQPSLDARADIEVCSSLDRPQFEHLFSRLACTRAICDPVAQKPEDCLESHTPYMSGLEARTASRLEG